MKRLKVIAAFIVAVLLVLQMPMMVWAAVDYHGDQNKIVNKTNFPDVDDDRMATY